MLAQRPYGNSGILVSALGLGAGQIGDARLDEAAVGSLLNAAVDAGITLIDTARGYGLSEERIGRHLAARRNEIVLSTKLGYGIDGFSDWTGPCITAGVEAALQRLRTDRIDIVHLHSCPAETLARGEVIDALDAAKRAGNLRAIAYSGENADLDYAVDCGRFDGFMASLNLCDQRVIEQVLPRIAGKGFIAKRPSANHPWRFAERPLGDYSEEYWLRWRAMDASNFVGRDRAPLCSVGARCVERNRRHRQPGQPCAEPRLVRPWPVAGLSARQSSSGLPAARSRLGRPALSKRR